MKPVSSFFIFDEMEILQSNNIVSDVTLSGGYNNGFRLFFHTDFEAFIN